MILFIALSILSVTMAVDRSERESCPKDLNVDCKSSSEYNLDIAVVGSEYRVVSTLLDGPRENELQKKKELNSLSLSDLKKTAKAAIFMMIAICHEATFSCKVCDIVFIATELAQGDPDCFLSCTAREVGRSFRRLPTDETLETFLKIGKVLREQANTINKRQALVTKGARLSGHARKNKERGVPVILIPVISTALEAIINVCAAAALGWAASNAQESGGLIGAAVDLIGPIVDVARANGCFMASSHVNVQLRDLRIVSKPLSHVKVGDMVESLDEITGNVLFTQVYYMAHSKGKTSSPLLSIYYKNENQGTSSLGLSERHLVYATKTNHSISEPPFSNPIQAKDLKIGDHLWVMNKDNQLKPQPIIEIVPFHSEVRHPLTENHHIIVDGVHASVHVLNEQLYRTMTSPLQILYQINPEWNKSGFIHRMVKLFESVKEPIFNNGLIGSISGVNMLHTISM